jgi:hypothetical protein
MTCAAQPEGSGIDRYEMAVRLFRRLRCRRILFTMWPTLLIVGLPALVTSAASRFGGRDIAGVTICSHGGTYAASTELAAHDAHVLAYAVVDNSVEFEPSWFPVMRRQEVKIASFEWAEWETRPMSELATDAAFCAAIASALEGASPELIAQALAAPSARGTNTGLARVNVSLAVPLVALHLCAFWCMFRESDLVTRTRRARAFVEGPPFNCLDCEYPLESRANRCPECGWLIDADPLAQ